MVHVLFCTALKWSFHGRGCSQSDVRSMAGQSPGKPEESPLQGQEGRCTASSALLFPKSCKDTKKTEQLVVTLSLSKGN